MSMHALPDRVPKRGTWQWVKLGFRLAVSTTVVVLALMFLIYPALTICAYMLDGQLSRTGQSRWTAGWFRSAAGRFVDWADWYLTTSHAGSIHHDDIPATEWPMFAATFVLVTAEDLHAQGQIDATQGIVREAVEKAAAIVASPVTATWVKTKWGDRYMEKENVFYRMLLILGLSSYERITGDIKYRDMMSRQRTTLAEELSQAKHHLSDDYPGECYPADMLWAVAAIQRAAKLENTQHDELAASLMAAFDGPVKAPEGLPAFQADSRSGHILQNARGCGNSGILLFAAELDAAIAGRWYADYEKHFWKDNGFLAGFTEQPLDWKEDFMDVDSGPVFQRIGSVASAFGIGAAKTFGRFDRAAPLTLEAVACSWPSPFGPLVPGAMGLLAAESWSLGEIALLFSMTRPVRVTETVSFTGHAPGIVWAMLAFYAGSGVLVIRLEIHGLRRHARRKET